MGKIGECGGSFGGMSFPRQSQRAKNRHLGSPGRVFALFPQSEIFLKMEGFDAMRANQDAGFNGGSSFNLPNLDVSI